MARAQSSVTGPLGVGRESPAGPLADTRGFIASHRGGHGVLFTTRRLRPFGGRLLRLRGSQSDAGFNRALTCISIGHC